jgi:hypothetical protein
MIFARQREKDLCNLVFFEGQWPRLTTKAIKIKALKEKQDGLSGFEDVKL